MNKVTHLPALNITPIGSFGSVWTQAGLGSWQVIVFDPRGRSMLAGMSNLVEMGTSSSAHPV